MKPVCITLLAFAPVLLAGVVGATETDVDHVASAEEAFRRGVEAFEQERFAEAVRSYREAWAVHQTYKTAAGLGQVELHLGEYRDAAEHLSYSLRHFPPDAEPTIRDQMAQGLARAREQIFALRVRVDVAGADILVDGSEVGTAPLEALLFVEPGPHVIRAVAEGHAPAEVSVRAVRGGAREITLSLERTKLPAANDAPPRADEQGVSRAPDPGIHAGIWALIVGGAATVGALTSAVVFDAKAASAQDDIDTLRTAIGEDAACSAPGADLTASCDRLAERVGDRNQSNRVAAFSAVATGVFAAGTVAATLLLWPSPDGEPEHARVRVSPGWGAVIMTGRF